MNLLTFLKTTQGAYIPLYLSDVLSSPSELEAFSVHLTCSCLIFFFSVTLSFIIISDGQG